jgi:hypothetical protein
MFEAKRKDEDESMRMKQQSKLENVTKSWRSRAHVDRAQDDADMNVSASGSGVREED